MPAFFMASKASSVGVRLARVKAVRVISGLKSGLADPEVEVKTGLVTSNVLYSVTPTHSPALARRMSGSFEWVLSVVTYCSGYVLVIGLAFVLPTGPEP